jgi:thymidylate synthase (FAD)
MTEKISVLNTGHVEYVSHMGDDLTVVNAARVSFNVESTEFKDRVGANDAQEARMLLQQRHGPRAVPYLPKMIPG